MSLTDGKVHINAFMSLPLTGGGPSYTFEKVLAEMRGPQTSVHLFSPADRRTVDYANVPTTSIIPKRARKVPFSVTSPIATPWAERRFVSQFKEGDNSVAYLWGDVTPSLVEKLRDRNIPIFREKYNCSKEVSRRILAEAYQKLDAQSDFPSSYYTDDVIEAENKILSGANAIYSPSPMVRASLEEVGVSSDKILDTSYGFDPARLETEHRALEKLEIPTFLFVGLVCVRKGAHILLEAWKKSKIKGRLVLVGKIESLIETRYADILAREDVEYHAFAKDIGSYFRSADFFIFPTLEEGGPQVTYEAAYCHLPSIVSQMGAGAIVRDGIEGSVVASDEVEDWVDALRFAAQEFADGKHKAKAAAAHMRALEFTWDKVGTRRRELLRGALLNVAPSAPIPAAG